ncbi:MAG: iron-containing alcohol dehydrogenase family protein [Candidatus Promineifilaceae bacterium]|jgi:alcohol dehydrogenase
MSQFNFHLPTKILFGLPVQTALVDALNALDVKKVLLVSDPGLEQIGLVDEVTVVIQKNGGAATRFTAVSSNPTTDEVSAGLELARAQQVDALVALGGGSPIDVAKGIALLLANGGSYADYQWGNKTINRRSWPLIAIPTTAGTGSEVSRVAVISDPANPFKKGVLSPLMFPHVAIADPQLTRDLPPWLTAATGIDAFTHALETFIGRRANPFTDQFAQAAMQTAWNYLPKATTNGSDRVFREKMMLAALWGGMAMDHSGLGLVHALSGPLTSHLHLHHGLANGVILPYVFAFNLPAISSEKRNFFVQLFGLEEPANDAALVKALFDFISDLGLPVTLQEITIPLDDLDWELIAEETTRMVLIQNNPREASVSDCRGVLEQMV